MSLRKCKCQGIHGMKRIKERCDVGTDVKNIQNYIKSASQKGYSPKSLDDGALKDYLLSKAQARDKRIKLYKGVVFVFNKTSDRLITAYKLPEEYLEEFKAIESIRHYHK